MGCFSKTAIFFALLAVYLGWQEYRLLKDASAPDCASLKLGEASSKIQWEKHQDHLIETLKKFAEQRRQGKLDDPDPKHQLKRVQHPVGWGCLNGTLSISTNESNQIGWIKGKSYPVEMRLSKGNFDPDNGPKVSSIGLKIHGVTGPRAPLSEESEKLRESNKDTQDLILISADILPLVAVPEEIISVHEYMMRFGALPGPILFLAIYRPTLLFRVFPFLLKGYGISVPFYAEHNTVHAYTHGSGAAVKYQLVPCQSVAMPPKGSEPNFVERLTQEELNHHDICMDLQIQRQRDSCVDPIDNLVVPWGGPFETIGRLNIPKGTKIANDQHCEKLSFNPWHAHADNTPLGWVANVRKLYGTMSASRQ